MVSNRGNSNFYVSLGKKLLKDNKTIELHSLGDATGNSISAAEALVK